jgi:hypothetical protein
MEKKWSRQRRNRVGHEIFFDSCHCGKVNLVSPSLQQFVSVALPIMLTLVVTIWLASWSQNKRFDDLRSDMSARFAEVHRRIDEILGRLDRIEKKLDGHEARIVRLEERTSLIR